MSRLASCGGSAYAGAHSCVAVRQRVALPLEFARRLVRLGELGLVVVHGGLQLCRLALCFLDAGVGVGQIEVLERDLQRKAHIRAPRRADVGIRLAQAQIHRRFVVGERAAALFGEGGRFERRIRCACRGVAQQVVDGQLPGVRNAPQLVFGMPSAMHSRVQEAR